MGTPTPHSTFGGPMRLYETQKNVAICVPSTDVVHADFAMCLATLSFNPGAKCALVSMKGSMVQVNRDNGVEMARNVKADYLLFIDSDMVFPQDCLKRLLAHGKDVVGATYRKRVPPYNILGRTLEAKRIEVESGLIEMEGLPTGMLLIRMAVFDRLKRPYFRMVAIEEDKEKGIPPSTLGEDYYFCNVARQAGFKVWLDVDLSKELGHIGQALYRIPDDYESKYPQPIAEAQVPKLA